MGVWTPGPGPTSGDDIYVGDAAVDVVSGGDGDDILSGGLGNDTLNGDAGIDTLQGGAGADIVSGGEGNDVLVVAATDGVVAGDTLSGGNGVDTLRVTGGQPGVVTNISLFNAQLSGIERIAFATSGVVQANFSTAQLPELNAATIVGSSNADTIQFLAFGPGTYSLATTAFTFENWDNGQNLGAANFENFIRPSDTLALAAVLPTNVTGNFNLTGSSGRDSIFGNAFNDVINGGDGNDILAGGLGIDQLFGGAGDDAIIVAGGVLPGNTLNSDEDYSLETYDGGAGRDFLTTVGTVVFNGTLTSFEGFAFGTNFDSDLTIPWSTVSLMPADVQVIGSDFVTQLIITASAASVINLSQWRFANSYWTDSQDLIGVIGSDGADQITGTTRTDYISAGLGDDIIDGGAGLDTAYYGFETAGVTVNLSIAGPQNTGGAGSDTLISIENIIGSDFDDTLTGDGGSNVLEGGLGNNTLNGGAGRDAASYDGASSGVTVSLAIAGPQVTGGAGTDTLIGIEDLIGSDNDDVLTGDANDNTLSGGIGIDTLNGGGGQDTASYAGADGAVFVSLAIAGQQDTGGDELDTLISIENLEGSRFSDTLTGSNGNNVLIGGAGNDTIDGGLGQDNVQGGAGDDVLVNSSFIGAGETLNGGDGLDTILMTGGFLVTGGAFRPTPDYLYTNLGQATLNSIERIAFSSTKSTFADFNINQLGAGVSNSLIIEGDGQVNAVRFLATVAGSYSLANTTFQLVNWDQGSTADLPPDQIVLASDWISLAVGGVTTDSFTLTGSSNRDWLAGGGGADILHGGAAGDLLVGGLGADQLFGDGGSDALVITDNNAGDFYDGGEGQDYLVATQVNTVFAGTAVNIEGFAFTEFGPSSLVVSKALVDTMGTSVNVFGGNVLDGSAAFANSLTINFATASVLDMSQWRFGVWQDDDRIFVNASSGDDTIIGSSRNDVLDGGDGNDVLYGGAGNDWTDGGAGDDVLVGGLGGVNNLIGGAGRDAISLAGSSANLFVDLAVGAYAYENGGWDALTSIEDVIGGAGSDTIFGDATGNLLLGGGGGDTLLGRDGSDTINGATGDDWLDGGSGDDVLEGGSGVNVLIGGAGTDLASYASQSANLWIDMTAGVYSAAGVWDVFFQSIEGVIGGSGNDSIFGNGLDNTLRGGTGDDALIGGAGNDRLEGGAGFDWIVGGEGNDRLIGGEGVDVLTGGAGADTFDLGTAAGWDVAFDFNTAEDRFSLGGLSWLGFLTIDADGDGQTDDTLLGYAGGNFVAIGVSGLSLTQWNALIDAPASAAAGAKIMADADRDPLAAWADPSPDAGAGYAPEADHGFSGFTQDIAYVQPHLPDGYVLIG